MTRRLFFRALTPSPWRGTNQTGDRPGRHCASRPNGPAPAWPRYISGTRDPIRSLRLFNTITGPPCRALHRPRQRPSPLMTSTLAHSSQSVMGAVVQTRTRANGGPENSTWTRSYLGRFLTGRIPDASGLPETLNSGFVGNCMRSVQRKRYHPPSPTWPLFGPPWDVPQDFTSGNTIPLTLWGSMSPMPVSTPGLPTWASAWTPQAMTADPWERCVDAPLHRAARRLQQFTTTTTARNVCRRAGNNPGKLQSRL